MYIVFKWIDVDSGPITGLSPLLYVLRLSDDTLILNGVTMTESAVRPGVYQYNWSGYDENEEYYIDADGGILAGEYRFARGGSTLARLSILDQMVKQNREGNFSFEFHPATVENLIRKVALDRLDYCIIRFKNDGDPDWSSPVATKTLYYWYENLGDHNPIYVKEAEP